MAPHAFAARSAWAMAFGLTVMAHCAAADAPHTRTGRFHLDAPCTQVFPLFTAKGETKWAEGWRPEMLSGDARRGSVFRTQHAHGAVATWIVTDYDPSAGRVSYARLTQGSNIGLVDVRCSTDGAGSAIDVTYTLTGLDADGDAFAATFTSEAHYTAMIEEWRLALTKALAAKP